MRLARLLNFGSAGTPAVEAAPVVAPPPPELLHSREVLDSFKNVFAYVEFDPSGIILAANANFLDTFGYQPGEVIGKHHRMFLPQADANGREYQTFWSDLAGGGIKGGEVRRIDKSGNIVWLATTYCPVRNASGAVVNIVELGANITAGKIKSQDNESILEAVSRSQGIISFTPSGEILEANSNFLDTMGYSREEVVGRHHRMFVTEAEASSQKYASFWRELAAGRFVSQEFRRIGKGGKEVLIQAAYNPVIDMDGRVVKITKMVFDLSVRMESIGRLGEALNKLAAGDLTCRIEKPLVETMERLRLDYNDAVTKMHDSMLKVVSASDEILRGMHSIYQGADDLSKRTEQQAASLQQSAVAVGEIAATGKTTADGASQASTVVGNAKANATQANEILSKTVEAMSNIETSSSEITKIIDTIDEIAFQTNLLSLNAGVEAARAGEAGRGFAIVASEVRALAQRTAKAAKEIQQLISRSSTQVSSGASLVSETNQALARIISQVDEIAVVMRGIVDGARNQSSGLQEVNAAIRDMDQATQKNAAMAEQTNAASHEMVELAKDLAGVIGQFQLDQSRMPAGEARRKPAKRSGHLARTDAQVSALRDSVAAAGSVASRPAKVAKVSGGDDGWEEF